MDYNHQRSDTVYDFLTTDKVLHEWNYEFQGLNLDDDVTDKILCGNFQRRVSEQPKPMNLEALKRYVCKYEHLITSEDCR